MVTVEGREIHYREGMSAADAIVEANADASMSIVLINESIVHDPRACRLRDGDVIRLLKIVSGG